MAFVELSNSPRAGGPGAPRGPRPSVPRLTIYPDGMGRITHAAREYLGGSQFVCIRHDEDNPTVIALTTHGNRLRRVTAQGAFSAGPFRALAGRPTEPIHIDLTADCGRLVGDIASARHGSLRPGRHAKIDAAESVAATTTLGGDVEHSGGPSASARSASPASVPDHDDDDAGDADDDDVDDDDY